MPQKRLIELMTHYFETAFEAAGLPFDYDNVSEIEEMVELIIEVAAREVEARSR